MIDCVSIVQSAAGLRPRRPIGLRRPTRDVDGFGSAELVRSERLHGWQVETQIVPTRLTKLDNFFRTTDDEADVVREWRRILNAETSIRHAVTQMALGDAEPSSIAHALKLVAPYRIEPSGDDYLLEYDFTDFDEDAKRDVALARVFVDTSFKITRLDTHSVETAPDWELRDAYKCRIVPNDCGFVADSIADRLICYGFSATTDDHAELLAASLSQTNELLVAARQSDKPFLRCARDLLTLFAAGRK